MLTVKKSVKSPSSQKTASQFTATTVLQIINLNAVKALDLEETIGVLDLVQETDDENHLLQLVMIVETNVKFHLSQEMTSQFTATTVSKITDKSILPCRNSS